MLTDELMKQVRRLEIITGRQVNELFAGEYHSAFKGLGMEFAEVREYQPGDDVRSIDWNVTARAGHPFVKRFVEERELTVILAVDLSGSGRFGSTDRLKSQLAAELCAVLAFAATKNNDKVGLVIFTDEIELFIPPKKGARHVLRIVREVLGFEPSRRGTDIRGALEHLARVLKKKAVVFVVSDFLDDGYDRALSILGRRHDVVAIAISDPRERGLPPVGLVELEDAETGRRVIVDTGSARLRRRHQARAVADALDLRDRLRRSGVDVIDVSTGAPYVQSLVSFFRMRERRR